MDEELSVAGPMGGAPQRGVEGFVREISRLAGRYPLSPAGTRAFVLTMAERYAYIRLQDALRQPLAFLRQMEGSPPEELGTGGFRQALVDDLNPARHYTAFVFVGYWLPHPFCLGVLWAWELAGALRYGSWSMPDVRSGYTGLRHGRMVHCHGHTILPSLIARDLSEQRRWSRLSRSGQAARWQEGCLR